MYISSISIGISMLMYQCKDGISSCLVFFAIGAKKKKPAPHVFNLICIQIRTYNRSFAHMKCLEVNLHIDL